MCSQNDYHFIIYLDGVVYNKQGTTDLAECCTVECMMGDIWMPHFHSSLQKQKYRFLLEGDIEKYDDGPIFFAFNRYWDD